MCSMGERCLKCRREEEEDDLELMVALWQRIKAGNLESPGNTADTEVSLGKVTGTERTF